MNFLHRLWPKKVIATNTLWKRLLEIIILGNFIKIPLFQQGLVEMRRFTSYFGVCNLLSLLGILLNFWFTLSVFIFLILMTILIEYSIIYSSFSWSLGSTLLARLIKLGLLVRFGDFLSFNFKIGLSFGLGRAWLFWNDLQIFHFKIYGGDKIILTIFW